MIISANHLSFQCARCRKHALRGLSVSLGRMHGSNYGNEALAILACLAHADITVEDLWTSGIAQVVLPFQKVSSGMAKTPAGVLDTPPQTGLQLLCSCLELKACCEPCPLRQDRLCHHQGLQEVSFTPSWHGHVVTPEIEIAWLS